MDHTLQRLHAASALLLGALLGTAGYAQQPAPAAAAPAASTPSSLSSSLGIFVFPAKDQSSTQQSTDEGACFNWAKSQTGIDPMNIKPPQPAAQPAQADVENAGNGSRARGAARGAAGGALIGAVTGDAGTGAAAGAVAGTLAGGAALAGALLLPFVGWTAFGLAFLLAVGTGVSALFSRRPRP